MLIAVSKTKTTDNIEILKSKPGDWLFGHIAYNLNHGFYNIPSESPNNDGFSTLCFFIPDWVISVNGNNGKIHYKPEYSEKDAQDILEQISKGQYFLPATKTKSINIKSISKEIYINTVRKIQQHIRRRDVYEMNYCIDFTAYVEIDPVETWQKMNEYSPAPFSAFYRNEASYVLCASPERFVKKHSTLLLSQPIKGTIGRNSDKIIDSENARHLISNAKERAENIMITDLVRNDLTKIAKINTVKVEELCSLYSFRHVHQLISTITAEIDKNITIWEIIQAAFPMGSMTGAPKSNAIKFAAQYESFRRGIYSGSIGYIDPDGNCDFNVVIRSIIYNAENKFVSIPAGSAITAESIPEAEYAECFLKVEALVKVLGF